MTVSMLMTRLSSVMTGCGGKEKTCSRRAISGLTRAKEGTARARAGSRGRWEGPRLEGLVLVERAGAPDLAADLDLAAAPVHALEHDRGRPDEGRRARAQLH